MHRITPYSFLKAMMYTYDFQIAGLVIRIKSPFVLAEFFELSDFRVSYAPDKLPDALYYIEVLPQDWNIQGTKLTQDEHSALYECSGELHRYYYWNMFSRDRYVLLVSPTDQSAHHRIYLQEDSLDRILPQFHLAAFLSPERLLLENRAFFLHASVVDWQGRGILFTAPSGTGKSTQARLWAELEGAEILNGDRAIIRRKEDGYWVYGSPYAGTSGIYRHRSVPLGAIVVLSQAKENTLRRLTPATAFRQLLPQVTALPWDGDFMEALTELLLDLVPQVPIYHLACLPNGDAVRVLKEDLAQ